MTVSAPGKLFLAGEYAVLRGGTAVVAAIDRRAVARFAPDAAASTPLIAEAGSAVRAHVEKGGPSLAAGSAEVDTQALQEDGRKLGLGSSAAATVAAVGALLEAAGRDVEGQRALVLALAGAAHQAAQAGRGSGGDVAAAVFGGVLAYSRDSRGAPHVAALAPEPPAELVVFRAGGPSATVDHLRAVERLSERAPAVHAARLEEIAAAAQTFLQAYRNSEVAVLIEAVERAHLALDALGSDADFPIVTPALGTAAALARACGGAAKPSGAGGGDVGVAFFPDPERAEAFRARAPKLDLPILSIKIDARGLRRDG